MVKPRKAFTLAEVLITLVVIGIIAAITVPVIMANHRKTEFSARLKKFYSTMNNAVKLAETEQGLTVYDWDYSLESKDFFDKYLAKYVRCTWGKVKEAGEENYYGFYDENSSISGTVKDACFMDDGSIFIFSTANRSEEMRYATIKYDLNGFSKPNKEGRDEFYFDFGTYYYKCNGVVGAGMDGCDFTFDPTRDDQMRLCKGSFWYCSRLLHMDGWEFKDDYPYRL